MRTNGPRSTKRSRPTHRQPRKIAEHGRRADGIVKSMLEHSARRNGERREVDLNGSIEEALTSPITVPVPRIRPSISGWTAPSPSDRRHRTGPPGHYPGVSRTCAATGSMRPPNARKWRRSEVPADPRMVQHAISADAVESASATTAPEFRPRSATSCSSHSSPPSRPGRARDWACRSAMTS